MNFNKLLTNIKNILKKRVIIIGVVSILITVFLGILFFKYYIYVFPDSVGYYNLAKIIRGEMSMKNWIAIRGFGFPLIIFFWTFLFGNNQFGLQMGSFIFWMLLISIMQYLLYKLLKHNNVNNRTIYYVGYFFLVVLNPIIFGYSHTLLTESVVPGLYALSIFLAYKWIVKKEKFSKINLTIHIIIFSLLGCLLWFIKQPYFIPYFVMLLVAALISILKNKSKTTVIRSGILALSSILTLVISIIIWDVVLNNSHLETINSPVQTDTVSSVGLLNISGVLVNGLNVYYELLPQEEYCDLEYMESLEISDSKREYFNQIVKSDKKWCEHLRVYAIKEIKKEDKDKVIDYEFLKMKDIVPSMSEGVGFYFNNLIKHPNYVFKSYLYNYLTISNVFTRKHGIYASTGKLKYNAVQENLTNGLICFNEKNSDELSMNQIDERIKFNAKENEVLTEALLLGKEIANYLYKILFVSIIPLLIIACIKYKTSKNETYCICILIYTLALTNILFHVLTGAIIDRYIYPAYPLLLLTLFILFIDKKKISVDVKKEYNNLEKENNNVIKEKNINTGNKNSIQEKILVSKSKRKNIQEEIILAQEKEQDIEVKIFEEENSSVKEEELKVPKKKNENIKEEELKLPKEKNKNVKNKEIIIPKEKKNDYEKNNNSNRQNQNKNYKKKNNKNKKKNQNKSQ